MNLALQIVIAITIFGVLQFFWLADSAQGAGGATAVFAVVYGGLAFILSKRTSGD